MGKYNPRVSTMLLSLVCCPLVLLVAVLTSPEPNPEDLHIHLHGLDKVVSDAGGRESTNMQISGGAPVIEDGQDYEDYGKKKKNKKKKESKKKKQNKRRNRRKKNKKKKKGKKKQGNDYGFVDSNYDETQEYSSNNWDD